jgi:hypothetical protein
MSGVFRTIDTPPPHRPASVYTPPPLVRGEDTLAGVERGWGGGGSIVWKTPDTALYSIYVSTLWFQLSVKETSSHGYSPLYTGERMGQAGWPSNELKA